MEPLPKRRAPLGAVLISLAALVVVPASVAWLVLFGAPRMNTEWQEAASLWAFDVIQDQGLHGYVGMSFTSAVDWLVSSIVPVLTVCQLGLSLLLLLASVAVLRGDEAGGWSLRTWAWWTLLIDVLAEMATGGMELWPWVRVVLALVVLRVIAPPPAIRADVFPGFDPPAGPAHA